MDKTNNNLASPTPGGGCRASECLCNVTVLILPQIKYFLSFTGWKRARAARTGRFGAGRHQTADRATLADVYGRDHRAPLHFTAGQPALLTFQPMYTNYGHLNRSYGQTVCSHRAGNVRHLFWPQANCQCNIPRVAGCIKLQNGLLIQFGNGWYNMWRMTVLVADRKFSLRLATFSNHLIMKQT